MSKKDVRDLIRYLIGGIMAIYGFFALIQPEKYPIYPPYTAFIGLVFLVVGIVIFFYEE